MDCHFLALEPGPGYDGKTRVFEWEPEDASRESIERLAASDAYACCYMGCWHEAFDPSKIDVQHEITKERNPIDCYYFGRTVGMGFRSGCKVAR